MKKPNLFILGAPKCGTTSLASWLSEHPNLFMSPVKEPHYFNTDGTTATKTSSEYERLFYKARNKHAIVGEASTHYLFSKNAVPKILDYNPSSKFIVCIRNPVEMAPSLHSERVWQGRETIKEFETAWHMQNNRRSGKRIPRTVKYDPERLQYGEFCKLGKQLKRVMSYVHESQLLPLLLEDIQNNARKEYLKVLSFLGLEYDNRRTFKKYNTNKKTRSVRISYLIKICAGLKQSCGCKTRFGMLRFLKMRNTKQCKREPLNGQLKKELITFYQEDILLLSSLLDRSLTHWIS